MPHYVHQIHKRSNGEHQIMNIQPSGNQTIQAHINFLVSSATHNKDAYDVLTLGLFIC